MHRLLDDERIAAYEGDLGRERIKRAAETIFGRVRLSGDGIENDALIAALTAELERLRRAVLQPVINATGIILHTNLGRAPLSSQALAAVAEASGGYSNLEYDADIGRRGSRYAGVAGLLRGVTGAEDALVVNNCAAAVLLVLDTFARGREVIVARNQLVEIGGGFRVPEVLERSGATLVEVGTTNRVYLEDFERALSPQTALILRTHASNYRMEGFVHDPSPAEMVELGRRAGVPLVEDLGGGALVDLAEFGVEHERTVQEAVSEGVGIVTFSGDKLLGGPQCGIIAGRAASIARVRNNPLLRALRVDKMTLAALGATLSSYRDDTWREEIPAYRMLSLTLDELQARAEVYVAAIASAAAVQSDAYVGAGSAPQLRIASISVAIVASDVVGLSNLLRRRRPPIVARIEEHRLLLDLRTVAPEQDEVVIAAVKHCLLQQ